MDKTVFSVYLGNPDNDNGTTLDLPVRPWAMRDALEKLRLREGQEPYWQVEDLGRYDFLTPYLDGYDLYKFNALAEKISTFDDVNAMAFEGLVQMKIDKLCQSNGSELTLQQVLDFAYSTDCCHVVAGITDDATLGHFYVENDFLPELENVPDRVLELLDYTKIGRTMREGEGGVFTPHGYVMQEAMLRQAPPNLGRPPREPPYMIYFLCVSDVRAVKLYLPAKQTELNAILDGLEVDGWQEVRLEDRDAAMPEMWTFTDMAYDGMEQLNRFARCLEELDMNGELVKFKAVAQQLQLFRLEEAIALTDHLDEYSFEPEIHSPRELARDELGVIAGDKEGKLLLPHLDLDAYGQDVMQRGNGVLGDYGYLARLDSQPIQAPRQEMELTM